MAGDKRDRELVTPPARPLGTGFLIFRAAATTILVLVFLAGVGLAAGSGYFLVEMARHPPEPPGQLAVGAFLFLAAVGVAFALAGIGGVVLLVRWSRRLARRASGG